MDVCLCIAFVGMGSNVSLKREAFMFDETSSNTHDVPLHEMIWFHLQQDPYQWLRVKAQLEQGASYHLP